MKRIAQTFSRLQAEGRKALIPYITAGDPQPNMTVNYMHQLVAGGADIIELGVPFSDPMADGPTIQLACERALSHGVTMSDVFAMVAEFRQQDNQTPVVLMGYLNPIEVMGYAQFAERAAQAGVDGVLTVDLPPEESAALSQELQVKGVEEIFLVAPTTTVERIKKICAAASGYLYYVSLKGVTGSATLNVAEVADRVALIKQHTDLPIGVGFGIRDGQSAAQVSKVADGVVVGSVLVNQIAAHQNEPEQAAGAIKSCLAEMRAAMDA